MGMPVLFSDAMQLEQSLGVKQRILDRGERRFDELWMQRVFDEFWHYARYTHALTDCMLMPPEHLPDLMGAMAENPEIAKDDLNGIHHPPSLSPWFFDPEAAKEYLGQKQASKVTSNIGCESVLTA